MTRGIVIYNISARIWRGTLDDNVAAVAASIAFFVLLAVFPAIAAVVTVVSLFVDPLRLEELLAAYSELVPRGSVSVLMQQIKRLSEAAGSQAEVVTFTPYFGFLVLLWGTNKGTKALFHSLNMIFDCKESRGFITFTLVTLAFTLAAIVFLVFSLGAVLLVPVVLKVIGLSGGHARWVEMLRWVVLLVIVSGAIAVIYRYGPSRKVAEWRSIISGSCLAAVLWVASSALFSWYVSAFRNFVELYGSLSAVIGFMVWIWLSSISVLIGAELDAALMKSSGAAGRPKANDDTI
ncbi:YihY/virulence factor BrkB family protein [Microvirga sp. BT688]|uniref:YihY/virulence factor BrkB family protein n=1 Tax=Microvirga sp. TaxID=1873136 RepID=UPI001689E0B6|nr:YihY/virulence factor BrkB family protein [Microvirga sp.]MBD2750843.1 YihY/virulence factor BrkB family protein [Microvirga sp.]